MYTRNKATYLLEANIVGVFSEALSAQIQAILADDSVLVGAGPAGNTQKKTPLTQLDFNTLADKNV